MKRFQGLKRLLCYIGIHNWKVFRQKDIKECRRCEKSVLTIHAITEKTLTNMLEEGKISYKGYVSAMKKGYVEKSDFDLKDDDIFDL